MVATFRKNLEIGNRINQAKIGKRRIKLGGQGRNWEKETKIETCNKIHLQPRPALCYCGQIGLAMRLCWHWLLIWFQHLCSMNVMRCQNIHTHTARLRRHYISAHPMTQYWHLCRINRPILNANFCKHSHKYISEFVLIYCNHLHYETYWFNANNLDNNRIFTLFKFCKLSKCKS